MVATLTAPLEVGDLAKACDVSVQTVRRWEAEGRIPTSMRTSSGRRLWSAENLQEIQRQREGRQATRAAGRELQTA